jgi:hypothetical protein
MGVVTAYGNDIFISYSHIDNEPFDEERRGWVDIFHAQLQQFVDVHVGKRTTFWRDKRLTGAEIFSDEIEQNLHSSAVLVTVVSPAYMNSAWCDRELGGFAKWASDHGELRVGNLQRVVKVLRLPVPRDALPPILDESLGAEFFRVDPASGKTRDLLVDDSADAVRVFRTRVDDVAQDLCRLLQAMAQLAAGPVAPAPAATGETVYLAWTTGDLSEERERLRRELEARGCRVVPAGLVPTDGPALRESVREGLRDARLAIHLIGVIRGLVPEGEVDSIVELQADDGLYRESGSTARRIVWLSPTGAERDEELSALIERLRTESELDLLENQCLEDLKTLVLERLSPPSSAAPAVVKSGTPLVYLICDQLDLEKARTIQGFLFDQQLEVRLPLFDGDAEAVRTEHYELLKECDGVLLYWGNANEAWLRTMLRDLNKVFGLGRSDPFGATALYLAGLPDAGKEAFRTHEVTTVRANGAFDPGSLSSFVALLSR